MAIRYLATRYISMKVFFYVTGAYKLFHFVVPLEVLHLTLFVNIKCFLNLFAYSTLIFNRATVLRTVLGLSNAQQDLSDPRRINRLHDVTRTPFTSHPKQFPPPVLLNCRKRLRYCLQS